MKNDKTELKEYSIPLVWSVCGKLKVQAHSEEEAIKIALGPDTSLPTDGNYIDDSLVVDEDGEIEVSDIVII